MQDIIIRQPWGGLGDNLQFSTLPELYAAKGHDVYISRYNTVRNPEIHDLVWGCNPYIKGYSDNTPNCGAPPYHFLKHPCIVTAWEVQFGFGEINKYPKIYYDYQHVDSLKDKVLIDLSYTTNTFDSKIVVPIVNRLISTIFRGKKACQVVFKTDFQPNFTRKEAPVQSHFGYEANSILSKTAAKDAKEGLPHFVFKNRIELNLPDFEVCNIFDYCDAISCAYGFITLFSGASVLASAIRQDEETPMIYVLKHTTDGIYIFDNIHYINI